MSYTTPMQNWKSYLFNEQYQKFYCHFPNTKEFRTYKQGKFTKSNYYKDCMACRNQLRVRKENNILELFICNLDAHYHFFRKEFKCIRELHKFSLNHLEKLSSAKQILDSLVTQQSIYDLMKYYFNFQTTLKQVQCTLKKCEKYFNQLDNHKLLESIDSKSVIQVMGDKKIFKAFLSMKPQIAGKFRYCIDMDGEILAKENSKSNGTNVIKQIANPIFSNLIFPPVQKNMFGLSIPMSESHYFSPFYLGPYGSSQFYPGVYIHMPDSQIVSFNKTANISPLNQTSKDYKVTLPKKVLSDHVSKLSPPKKMIFCSEKGCFSLSRKAENKISIKASKNVYLGKMLISGEKKRDVIILTTMPETINSKNSYTDKTTRLSAEFSNLKLLDSTDKVVQPFDYFEVPFEKYCFGFLVEEYCKIGNLSKYLLENIDITDKERIHLMDSVINAVYGIYERGYLHGDLKLENFVLKDSLLSKFKEVLLIDLEGMFKRNATFKEKIDSIYTSIFVDPIYAKAFNLALYKAAEKSNEGTLSKKAALYLFDKTFIFLNEKSEVWTLGLVLFSIRYKVCLIMKILTNKIPKDILYQTNPKEIKKLVADIKQTEIDNFFPNEMDAIDQLIHSMLLLDQNCRPTIQEVKQQWDKMMNVESLKN